MGPKTNSGFSIIELIIVMVIVAILLVSFYARFVGIREDAQERVREQVRVALQQGIEFSALKWQTSGRPQGGNISNGPQIEYQAGLMVTVDRNTGFPVGDHNRDVVNNMNLRDCVQVLTDLVDQAFTIRHRGQVNNSNFSQFDIIVTRTNTNPDVCNYYWSDTLTSRPNNAAPSTGEGFRYFPATGEVIAFAF